MTATAVIARRGAERVRAGHPWVYRSDVIEANADPGDLARVSTDHGRFVGWAFFSAASQITLRFISTRKEPPDDRALIKDRLDEAARFRASLAIDATAFRLL